MTPQERTQLLTRVQQLVEQRFGEQGRSLSKEQWQASKDEEQRLLMEYAENLVYQSVSRCPICQAELKLPIDTAGLDGAWWWNLCPVDLPAPLACEHFVVFLGALDLQGRSPVEVTRTVIAGPSRPFLIDRLMELEGMTAVISQIPIEPGYTGFLIAYFSKMPIDQADMHQEWRRDSYPLLNANGEPVASGQKLDFWNFHLEDWTGLGKLFFISANDPDCALQETPPPEYSQNLSIDMMQQITNGVIQYQEPPTGGDTGIYATVD